MMFLLFMASMFGIAGNVVGGSVNFAATSLTVAVGASDTTIYVKDTTGFPDPGIIQIENEQISYSGTTATNFHGNIIQPLARGVNGTTASAHPITAAVRTQEGGFMNNVTSYSIATISDASGIQAFVSVPIALFTLIGSVLFAPIDFFGTDLAWLTYLWAIFGIGFLVALTIQMGGGRKMS